MAEPAAVERAGVAAASLAAAEQVPAWVAATQATLGRFVEKPRLTAERLQKPPFRFLFDVLAEVARQTGFGLTELFGGGLGDTPVAPSSRDDKVAFLERWRELTTAACGTDGASLLSAVSAQCIVCGQKPMLTNLLLQCTAAAAWPQVCAVPRFRSATTETTNVPAAPVAEELPEGWSAHIDSNTGRTFYHHAASQKTTWDSPAAQPTTAPQAVAATQEAPVAVEEVVAAQKTHAMGARAEEHPAAEVEPVGTGPAIDLEEAKKLAEKMDFGSAFQEFDALCEELAVTKSNFRPAGAGIELDSKDNPRKDGAPAAAAQEHSMDLADESATDDDDDDEENDASGEVNPVMQATFRGASEKVHKIQDSLMQAQDLLDAIEEGIERTQAEKNAASEARAAALEAARAQEEARKHRLVEAQFAAEAEAERELASKKAAAAEAKAAKAAEKARRAAEQATRKEEKARAAKFPQSRHAMSATARMVSCLDSGEVEEHNEPQRKDTSEPPKPSEPNGHPAFGALGGVLGSGIGSSGGGTTASLFDRLKAQFKDTLVSYLCASMPEILLKQYKGEELILCLQLVLKELRLAISQHSLEDVQDEDPTSVSEELRKRSPDGWLSILQNTPPHLLRRSYDVTELVDTLQMLSQTCFERLNDEIGPITAWTDESSPLRTEPAAAAYATVSENPSHSHVDVGRPLEMISETPDLPHSHSGASLARASNGTKTAAQARNSSAASPPPWEKDARPASTMPKTAGTRSAPTFDASLGPPAWEKELARPPPQTASRAPVFDATLGPASWELPGGGAPAPTLTRHGSPSPSRQPTASRVRAVTTQGIGYSSR